MASVAGRAAPAARRDLAGLPQEDECRDEPSYEEAVEEALCFGWIDSTAKRLDEARTLQLFAPRKPRSTWSASNKERVARLEREGLLAPAGNAAIEVAKENGSWSALDAVERLEEPLDLAGALDTDAAARENWNGFSRSSRKAILWWVVSAKRPETRTKRVDQTVRMAAKGLRAQFDRE